MKETNWASQARQPLRANPLHPLLVTLPIGSLVGAFLSDVAFAGSSDGALVCRPPYSR